MGPIQQHVPINFIVCGTSLTYEHQVYASIYIHKIENLVVTKYGWAPIPKSILGALHHSDPVSSLDLRSQQNISKLFATHGERRHADSLASKALGGSRGTT